jgi:hypothetical protein
MGSGAMIIVPSSKSTGSAIPDTLTGGLISPNLRVLPQKEESKLKEELYSLYVIRIS